MAFEGIDGAGKTTQLNLIAKKLEESGEEVVVSKEPTEGKWGQKIKKSAERGRLPLDEELEAFVEDRKEHIKNVINPNLDAGRVVILDRYFYSTVSYQGSRGADYKKVEKHMKQFAPIPDMVFLLDLSPVESLERISKLRKEIPNQFEKLETLKSVRKVFNSIEKQDDEIWKLDGSLPIKTIHSTVISLLLENALKDKRCKKRYGCDNYYHCGERLIQNCRWIELYEYLSPHAMSDQNTALLI